MRRGPKSHCSVCRKLFDSAEIGTWVQVTGWAEVRSRGGTNAIKERSETGHVLCPHCAYDRTLGRIPGQTDLFTSKEKGNQ